MFHRLIALILLYQSPNLTCGKNVNLTNDPVENSLVPSF